MSLPKRLRASLRSAKFVTAVVVAGSGTITYMIMKTKRTVDGIVRHRALDRETKAAPEYIYINDPTYQHKDATESGGLRSLRYSVMWRLLWMCQHGGREQRNLALQQLAAIKKSKDWEYYKLARALDAETAVLLARTEGADPRYFLPPPAHVRRAAHAPGSGALRFSSIMRQLKQDSPHACTDYFISKYFSSGKENDSASKPDASTERKLCLICLDAVHHHLILTDDINDESVTPTHRGVVEVVAEMLERYKGDQDVELSAVKVLTVLSARPDLLQHMFINGLLGHLARWLRSSDVRMACSAAASLANLAREGQYRGGLYVLHPIYRSSEPVYCDVLFLHGLRGGVFVTWRQRDPKNSAPLGIFGKKRSGGRDAKNAGIAVHISEIAEKMQRRGPKAKSDGEKTDSGLADASKNETETVMTGAKDSSSSDFSSGYLSDPDLQQVIADLEDMDEDALLADLEVVVHDIPDYSARDHSWTEYTTQRKREALRQEMEDLRSYTSCWPKDWLPKDCPNLRVLGVDYWTSVSEWTGGCGAGGTLEQGAAALRATLQLAHVGRSPLVAVAHSMGGLIIERALLDSAASSSPEERQLAERTRALVFYSTPHQGSTLANLPRGTSALLWPSILVRQLQEGSPSLLQLQRDFISVAKQHGWETVSFGESKPTLVSPFKVPIHFVQAESADLGRGPFYRLPLDHLSICKPATRQSLLYTSLVDILKRVVHDEQERRHANTIEGQWSDWWRRHLSNTASESETEKWTPPAGLWKVWPFSEVFKLLRAI